MWSSVIPVAGILGFLLFVLGERVIRGNRGIVWAASCYGLIYLVIGMVGLLTDLSLTWKELGNWLSLGFLLLPLVPWFWLQRIRASRLRKAASAGYIVLLMLFYAVSSIGIYFVVHDVVEGRVPHAVFERPLPGERSIVIYRLPPSALSDDYQTAIVKKVVPGLELKHLLEDYEIHYDRFTDSNRVLIDGEYYHLPLYRELGNIPDSEGQE